MDIDEKCRDLERWAGKSLGNNKRTSPVTIVSAIVARDTILMVSDSRTTNENGTVRDDTKKVFTVRLADGFGFLIGQSGNDDLGARAIEITFQLAKETTKKDYRTCADMVQKAVSVLKQEIREQFKGTGEELQRHFERNSFDLIIAHYFRDGDEKKKQFPQPQIFTLNFSTGSARRHFEKSFVSIGCGSTIADLLLDGFDVSSFAFWQSLAAGVYVVGQVKKFDPRCGGKIQVAIAEKRLYVDGSCDYPVWPIEESLIDDFVNVTGEVANEFKAAQHETISNILEKIDKYIPANASRGTMLSYRSLSASDVADEQTPLFCSNRE